MKKFLAPIIALAFAAITETHAQDLQRGIVIVSPGDTLRGMLSQRAMDNYECELTTTDGNTTKYTPDRVIAFYIPGTIYFERAQIEADGQTQLVFMNVAVSGKADLLERKGNLYLHYDNEDNAIELKTESQKRTVDAKEYVVTIDLYKDVLKSKLVGCPNAADLMKSTGLTKKSIGRLLNTYNACFGGSSAKQQTTKKGTRPWVSIGAEYNFLTTKLGNPGTSTSIKQSTFKDPLSPNFPSFYIQLNPAVARSLSLQLAGYSVSYQYNGYAEGVVAIPPSNDTEEWRDDLYRFRTEVKYKSFVMPLMVKYSFLQGRVIQPTLGAGLGFHFNSKFAGSETTTDVEPQQTLSTSKFPPVRPKVMSFRSVAGVNVRLGAFLFGGNVLMEIMKSPMNFYSRVTAGKFNSNQTNVGFTISAGVLLGQ
jgi:hypothetical protein